MEIKIVLYVDEKNISQINWNTDNKFIAEDINEILNSKHIPVEKTIEVITKILNNKYEK